VANANNVDAMLDSLLNSNVADTSANILTEAHGIAAKVGKDSYQQIVAHRNIATYSTDQEFLACPRKWIINKVQAAMGINNRHSSVTFAFGHAVGAGVAEFDRTQNLDKAYMAAFLAWDVDLLATELDSKGKSNGKSFWEALVALDLYAEFYYSDPVAELESYETVMIEGTIVIDLENGYFAVLHIDEVLRNKYTGSFRIKENKTTASVTVDPARYANSEQALGYSVAISLLGGQDYEVLYTIFSSKDGRWISFPFPKTPLAKAEWMQDQLLISEQKEMYRETGFYPKRGNACVAYNRRCSEFGLCDISLNKRYANGLNNLRVLERAEDFAQLEKVDMFVKLSQLVANQRTSTSTSEI